MVFVPTMVGITGKYHSPLRWGDYGRISFAPTMGGLRANIIRPYDGGDYGQISFAPTMGGMVLKILPPVVQNVLKIPREGAFLAQGRINAPPHQQHTAEIGVGIVIWMKN